jgi:hypothetical protein
LNISSRFSFRKTMNENTFLSKSKLYLLFSCFSYWNSNYSWFFQNLDLRILFSTETSQFRWETLRKAFWKFSSKYSL